MEYMMKLKHNKLKNTQIIFEVLTSKLVNEAINNDKSIALALVKKHFNQKSILFKELAMYKSLLANKNITESNFEKYLELVIESRKRLPEIALKTAKYNVIKDIKYRYGDNFLKEGFDVKFKNYKTMASIFKLFEYDAVDNPPEVLECRNAIFENIKNSNETIVEANVTPWDGLTKDVRVLGFRKLIEKFNTKYEVLLPRQKKILQTLINSPEKLNEVLATEIKYITETLNKSTITDEATKIKVEQLGSMLANINLNKVTDEHLSVVMKSHQLLNELKG